MILIVVVALLALVVFALLFGMTALPLMLPLLLFSGVHQVLDGNTAAIGPMPVVSVQPGVMIGGRPSQFALGLNPIDAYAACGPDAAVALGRWFGVDLPITRVMSVAANGLWDAKTGMYGVFAEQTLLSRLGLSTQLEVPISWQHVTAELAAGRPVILDTPGHYYYADALNGSLLHVGTSGTDLRGGSAWMSATQINDHPVSQGSVRAAIYASTPLPPNRPGGMH